MSLILSGTDGLSDVDGTAATPAIRGTDANTGIFFGADIIGFSEGGVEAARINADSQFVAAAGTAALPVITTTGDTNTGIFFPAADTIAFSEGGAEAMRIDSSGNVGIGTSSPSTFPAKFAVSGFVTSGGQNYSAGFSDAVNSTFRIGHQSGLTNLITDAALAFYTASAERMRIDSSGNLLVGDTGVTGYRLVVKGASATSSDYATLMRNSSNTELFSVRNDGRFVTGTGSASPYNNTTGGAANFVVNSDGACQRSTSSLKYKTEVQDATHGLAEVMSLRPVTYKGKNDGDKVFGGLIAEEVHETGLTEFVQYADDGSPDALAYGNMVSLCIKAIQEQQALIQSLTTRITALETPAVTPSTGTQA